MIATEAERLAVRRRDAALVVSCPVCGAPAGVSCTEPPPGWAAHQVRVHFAAGGR